MNPSDEAEAGEEKVSEPIKNVPDEAAGKPVTGKDVLAALRSTNAEYERGHKFWNTQPVLRSNQNITDDDTGPIEGPHQVPATPCALPKEFYWETADVQDDGQIQQIYEFLKCNYVEDDDSMFRFDYSQESLRWALTPPGYQHDWHVAVRAKGTDKLVGFISGVPARLSVCGVEVDLAEINFLCGHKKLREKRFAPTLIREVTRRINATGIWQAVFTAGVELPTPVAKCRYWHRSLNPKKLVQIQFSHLGPRMTLSRAEKLYRLNPEPMIPGIRPMEKKDVPGVKQLLDNELKCFKFRVVMSEADVEHWLLPRKGVVYSYVREIDGKVTDLTSFYSLPSSVINHPVHKRLEAAYSYYNAATSVTCEQLIADALTLAHNEGFDVYNALDAMHNSKELLEGLKFARGDGNLHYNLYNFKCPALQPNDIGLILM
eukprot:GHVU01067363.1.p1 GENE.GHVU01067363.1~~GHVU01067363.1.p1  ORF type:complete len:431 (-),score=63.85 GHVU01067363.1:510-1802(-)